MARQRKAIPKLEETHKISKMLRWEYFTRPLGFRQLLGKIVPVP